MVILVVPVPIIMALADRFESVANGWTGNKKPPEGGFLWYQVQARSVELFLDTSGLAGQGAQVVQLGLAHVTTALDSDAVNHRGVGLEGTLDAYTAGDLAHGESGVQTTVTLTDNHAFEGLQTLTVAFLHFYRSEEHTSELQSRPH